MYANTPTQQKKQGASQIYRRVLHPYLDKYEGEIDHGLEEMRAGATRKIQSLGVSAASEIAKAVTRQGSTAVSFVSLSVDVEVFLLECSLDYFPCEPHAELLWLLVFYWRM